jgi:hypothetical protein
MHFMVFENELTIRPAPVETEGPEEPPVILRQWRYSLTGRHLVGYVYNHPTLPCADGKRIRTSRLVWVREDVGLAQTLNTLYVLRDRDI